MLPNNNNNLRDIASSSIHDKKALNLSNNHHLKNLKQQFNDRKLINLIIDLINLNDHDTLAYIARMIGIPPQLRHIVWPILLKYHPMCISPNIYSNVVTWDQQTNSFQLINNTNNNKNSNSTSISNDDSNNDTYSTTNNNSNKYSAHKNTNTQMNTSINNGIDNDNDGDLDDVILHDLRKYFHTRSNNNKTSNSNTTTDNPLTTPIKSTFPSNDFNDIELQIIEILKNAILCFLSKWSKIFKYENGLTWVALGLAEWISPLSQNQIINEFDPIILTGRKHSNEQKDMKKKFNIIDNLYNEYPLPIKSRNGLPNEKYQFEFNELYERVLLVILHCPDTVYALEQVNNEFPSMNESTSLSSSTSPSTTSKRAPASSNPNHSTNYFPILSGGDLTFQTQMFFKVFQSILPELYQPLVEETNFPQTSSSRLTWLYWWIKFSGAKALQRQDRGRIWDSLFGWRPKPNSMDSINFYLNYNSKIFNHLYQGSPVGFKVFKNEINYLQKFKKNYDNNIDPFWFPDLNNVPIGSKEFPFDHNVLIEILARNKYVKNNNNSNNGPSSNNANMGKSNITQTISTTNSTASSNYSISSSRSSSSTSLNTVDNDTITSSSEGESPLIYSLVDPHVQLIFIYIAILQYNEFKLLEFEETEISEFLNNVPMLSKTDDKNFRNLYLMEEYSEKFDSINQNNSGTNQFTGKRKQTKSHSISISSSTTNSSSSSIASSSMSSSRSNNMSNNNRLSGKSKNYHHMIIEVGNDAKASHSFNDILNIAGDIWRKWLWKELEENSIAD